MIGYIELDSGQENNEKYRLKCEPDLGASANVYGKTIKLIMASTFVGEKPLRKVYRHDKKTKDHVEIIRPHAIEEYNKHMGSVDLLGSIIAQHKILMRSKKWYMRIFLSFVRSSYRKCMVTIQECGN
ncbi:piggyBac transposable element-derived protein 3-like [Stegodyphus dumicola]|uniref:piggyBac transposable element-derived protein 3-like n=1 Tax=Stegodyphus dumicola TaxID=202533 RepID=UPI0015AC6CC7|nr:piggyBac transposable element-derived protein 3-like [Stegodyphus dumicola]